MFINGIVTPNVTATHNYFGVYEDAEATLECIVEAYPLPANNWIKGSKILKAYDDVNAGAATGSNITSYGVFVGGPANTNILSSTLLFGSGNAGSTDHDEMISHR